MTEKQLKIIRDLGNMKILEEQGIDINYIVLKFNGKVLSTTFSEICAGKEYHSKLDQEIPFEINIYRRKESDGKEFMIKHKKEVQNKMAKLGDEAMAYEPKQTKNIADLEIVSLMQEVEDREGTDKQGKKFNYKVIVIANEEYRVPNSVLGDIKSLKEAKPNLKSVRVIKKGVGLSTEYTVIPME